MALDGGLVAGLGRGQEIGGHEDVLGEQRAQLLAGGTQRDERAAQQGECNDDPEGERDPLATLRAPIVVRPVTTERTFCSRMSLSLGPRAASSSDLISSQLLRFSPGRRRIRTKCQPPPSRSPSR